MSWHENLHNDPYDDLYETPEGCRRDIIRATVGLAILGLVFSIALGCL